MHEVDIIAGLGYTDGSWDNDSNCVIGVVCSSWCNAPELVLSEVCSILRNGGETSSFTSDPLSFPYGEGGYSVDKSTGRAKNDRFLQKGQILLWVILYHFIFMCPGLLAFR